MHDYVMHYLDLFDALGLDKFRLVGFSLGGWLAANFAVEHGHRVERLVLVGPAGLRGKERPKGDFFMLPPEKIPALLVSNFDVIKPFLPEGSQDLDFMGERYREGGTLARLLWEHPYDTKLPRYLHRLTMPTLLVWGEDDQAPAGAEAEFWRQLHSQGGIPDFQRRGSPRARRKTRSRRRGAALSVLTRQRIALRISRHADRGPRRGWFHV